MTLARSGESPATSGRLDDRHVSRGSLSVTEFLNRALSLTHVIVPICAAACIAGLTVWSDSSQREFLLAILAVVIPLPIIVRILQRQFDPFEPIALLSLSFFLLFVLRPIAHLAYDEMTYGGMSIDPGFDSALLVASVGVIALYSGYAMRFGRGIARRLRPLPSMLKPDATIAIAGALLLVGLVLYLLYIEQVGGLKVAGKLLRGRDPLEGLVISQTTAYFRFGPFLAIPATLLLFEAAAAKRRALFVLVSAVGTGLFVVLLTAPRGDRLWLMLLVMGVFVLPYLRVQRRPKMRTLALLGVLWFAFGITFLQEVRVPVVREGPPIELFKRAAANPVRGWRDFILGADTEMFPILALETDRVPTTQPHEPGLTIVSLVTTWIPRRLYVSKPTEPDTKVYEMLFPLRASVSRAGTSPSIFGVFYYDSGLVGVAIGALLFGILARALFEYLVIHPTNVGVRLLYAATLPLIAVTVRGSPTDTIGRMAYIVLPIIVALWWTGLRHPLGAHRGSPVPARR